MHKARNAFTLIEVMVAVVIISVVIMALLELFANNSKIFSMLSLKSENNQYKSLLISSTNYGFEDKKTTLYELVREFDLESDLRQELKAKKVQLIYQELEFIDMSEESIRDEESEQESSQAPSMVFEIGKSVMNFENSSSSFLRIRSQ